MESRWGGLLIDIFRPPVFVQLMARSLQIASFHVAFLSEQPIYLKLLFLYLATWVPVPGTIRFCHRELLGRWGQIGLYYLAFQVLQYDFVSSVNLPVLALSAYAVLPFRLSSTLVCVNLSHLAKSEANRLKAKNQLPMLAVGCFLVQIPHFFGVKDAIIEILAVMLFLLAFTLYLEKLQKNLPLSDFLSHFLMLAYYLIPAIIAIIFSSYV